MPPLADDLTARVIGAHAMLGRLHPDSPCAKRRATQAPPQLGHDPDAWQRALALRQRAERWADAHPEAHARWRAIAADLPALDDPLRRLRAQEPLRDADLFAIKRALVHALATCELPDSPLASYCQLDTQRAQLTDWLQQLHPEPEPTLRFHLSAQLDPALGPARDAQQRARRALRDAQRALESALRADYTGASFDLEGDMRLSHAPASIERDARLGRVGPTTFRPISDEIERASALHEEARAHTEQLEHQARARLSAIFSAHVDALDALQERLIALDLDLACARLRRALEGCWPTWRDAPGWTLTQGCDPAVRDALGDDAQRVDLRLEGAAPLIITGPNMGGKSALLRLLGLSQWCAQHALPVPARSFSFNPVASICYVGSEIEQVGESREGLSSFGREVRRIVEAPGGKASPRRGGLGGRCRGPPPGEGGGAAGGGPCWVGGGGPPLGGGGARPPPPAPLAARRAVPRHTPG